MVDEVPGGAVHRLELHGQCPQAAVTGQPEGRVLLEDLAVQVHADVRSHVLGADLQDLAKHGKKTRQDPCGGLQLAALSAPQGPKRHPLD